MNIPPSFWIRTSRPNPRAALRLFCVPHAGGSPEMFSSWPQRLPAAVEVCGLCLPGRSVRMSEPLVTSLSQLVEGLSEALQDELHKPYALYGHSMGGLVCFELIRQLSAKGASMPRRLFVSGCYAPHIPDSAPIHMLPDDDFIRELNRFRTVPEEMSGDRELLDLFLPILRADAAVTETYVYAPAPPLNCPITAYIGAEDPVVGRADMEAWRQHTSRDFQTHVFPGDHFFIESSRAEVLSVLSNDLNRILQANSR
ncbi:thioesterase II family protein [uncultured Paludibaculum sp.]|uniref:thioesterase II family protein n=1 Tax=uncultured Paludibaculum sp. TaxID=1765020 RepID=UPI00374DB7D7